MMTATADTIPVRSTVCCVNEVPSLGARRLFLVSLVYLFALFASLIVERVLHIAPLALWI